MAPPQNAPFSSVGTSDNTSQSQSLAPIAAAATAAAQKLSTAPDSRKAFSPRITPQPLTAASALADQQRAREERAMAQAGGTSPNPALAVLSSLQGQQTSPARLTDAKTAQNTAGRALQLHPEVQQQSPKHQQPQQPQTQTQLPQIINQHVQSSPQPMSDAPSLNDVSTNPATTAPTLATAMPTANDEAVATSSSAVEQRSDRAAVDPGLSATREDSRAFTYPPPPSALPEEFRGTPTRNMSLPIPGSGESPRGGSGQRRHKCPYCNTDFTRHHNLKSHLLTHSQEKPYGCDTCNARFRRLHDLKRHQKLHTGERPHICNKCGRKFARGDALARHNKGNGGCAGRRSSFGLDGGEGMEGVEYTAEPENMDDSELDADSRRPGDTTMDTMSRSNSMYSSRQNSTYPPLGPGRSNGTVANMFPPSNAPSHNDSTSSTLQPFPTAGHAVFQQGISESPKPLSPGQPATSRSHGPSLPPPSGQGSQLPPITGLRTGSQSGSSGAGSGSSMRDFLGRTEADVFNYARDLEARLAEKEAKIAQMEQQFRDMQEKIQRLEGSAHSMLPPATSAPVVPFASAGAPTDVKPSA